MHADPHSPNPSSNAPGVACGDLVRVYRWTRARKIRITIARTLFHALLDGMGSEDESLKAEVWKRIDRELDAAKLTRDAL
jgi:hypothetical protein